MKSCLSRSQARAAAPMRRGAAVRCAALPHSFDALPQRAAAALAAALLTCSTAAPALATGLEAIDLLPSSIETPAMLAAMAEGRREKLAEADSAFQNSDTLKKLLEKSRENADKNKKEVQNKYCYRQAELGIGDCGGLRYIPGMTKNGKQKTPDWLVQALGVEMPSYEGEGRTIEELLGPKAE